jgi:hypothetical protein
MWVSEWVSEWVSDWSDQSEVKMNGSLHSWCLWRANREVICCKPITGCVEGEELDLELVLTVAGQWPSCRPSDRRNTDTISRVRVLKQSSPETTSWNQRGHSEGTQRTQWLCQPGWIYPKENWGKRGLGLICSPCRSRQSESLQGAEGKSLFAALYGVYTLTLLETYAVPTDRPKTKGGVLRMALGTVPC